MDQVKALLFDVFGTTVDWRSTVERVLASTCAHALSARPASEIPARASTMRSAEWARFADEWRQTYYRFTRTLAANPSAVPYTTIDEHHLSSLQELLHAWQLDGLWTDAEVHELSLVWHRLDPWPDTVAGLRALNTRFATCTLSNGNVALLTDMAEYARLEWTHVFSAEMFKSYKPDPAVYLGAARKLELEPRQCAMVAAHLGDLKAAKQCGFRTVYVKRRKEEALDPDEERQEGYVDVWIEEHEDGFLAVAERLGVNM